LSNDIQKILLLFSNNQYGQTLINTRNYYVLYRSINERYNKYVEVSDLFTVNLNKKNKFL